MPGSFGITSLVGNAVTVLAVERRASIRTVEIATAATPVVFQEIHTVELARSIGLDAFRGALTADTGVGIRLAIEPILGCAAKAPAVVISAAVPAQAVSAHMQAFPAGAESGAIDVTFLGAIFGAMIRSAAFLAAVVAEVGLIHRAGAGAILAALAGAARLADTTAAVR